MSSHAKKGHPHSDSHHAIPQLTLASVFLALVVLMFLTIAASFMQGVPTIWMNVIALTIAVIKATLVITVFMGVGYSTRLVRLYAWGGFAWFTLMFIMMADYMTRPNEPVVGWEPQSANALPRGTVNKPD